jgi:ADP-heptose:LPS heptosyltransferase
MKRLLIIKPSSMGDIIHGLLVAEAIKAQLPGVTIDWVVRREFAPLIDSASAIENTLIFERKGGLGSFIALIRKIRQTRYDAVLDMQGLARTGLLTFCAKGFRKIGRSDAREGACLAYRETSAVLPHGSPVHAVKILSGFLEILSLEPTLLHSIYFDASKKALTLPPCEGLRRVVIFPESRRAEKNWSGYEALTRRLLDSEYGLQVLWCGHVPFKASQSMDSNNFYNLTGETQIDQLPELLNSADCVLSNDSGPMHLAAALARPLVALFGPTDPARFGPFPADSQRQRVIRRADGDMASLNVQEVEQALFEVLL